MTKNKFCICVASFLACAIAVTLIAVNSERTEKFGGVQVVTGTEPEYTAALGPAAFTYSSLTTEYQELVTQTFGAEDYSIVMNYSLAKRDNAYNLVLAPYGKLYNYDLTGAKAYGGRITNVKSVTVNYSGGTLFVQEGIGGEGTVYGKKTALVSGEAYTCTTNPNYIMVSNAHAETTITSVVVKYSCVEAGFTVSRLGNKYIGKALHEGNLVNLTLEVDGSNVSVAGQNGTIAVDALGNFTITVGGGAVVYGGTVSSDYKTLEFTSKDGPGKAMFPDFLEMNRVYVMDDFESYLGTGEKYTQNKVTSIYTATDLRAAYYGDYGGGGSTTWISGSDFNCATSADFINLTSAVKHNGDQAITIKGWNGGWTRIWSKETFDMNQHFNYGQGNRLSFWAHGAYTNTACSSASSKNVKLSVVVYYQNFVITDSNRKSETYGTGKVDFTIPNGSDWTEYKVNIDPYKHVYAINFMIDGNGSGLSQNVYVPVDDITIYTEPAYAPKEYAPTSEKITKTYNGEVQLINGKTATIKIGLGANGYTYGWCYDNMVPTGYTIDGDSILIETTGKIHIPDDPEDPESPGTDYPFGNWTGTFNAEKTSITFNKSGITGTAKNLISPSSFIINEDTIFVNGTEQTAYLLSVFKRQKKVNSVWTDYENQAEQIQLTSNYSIDGNNAIILTPDSEYETRLIVNPAIAESLHMDIESIAFWYYVPAGVKYTLNLFSYNSYTPGGDYKNPSSNPYNASNPGGWKYINCGLTANYGNNISIYIGKTSSPTIIDYVTYF